jgi:phosphotransferase system  glucose/maltose/N-acetylglucosamine-specific IIC component
MGKNKLVQYTKKIVTALTICAVVWISWSYVLATIQFFVTGMTNTLESLSTNVCTIILGTVISYMIKSFVETYCERKNNLTKQKYDDMMNLINNTDISPDQIVGVYEKIK